MPRCDPYRRWACALLLVLPGCVGLDGFVAAQRFRLAERQIMEDRSFEYLAIYEIECEDINKALDALNAGSQDMVISESLAEGAKAIAFSAIGERYEPGAD